LLLLRSGRRFSLIVFSFLSEIGGVFPFVGRSSLFFIFFNVSIYIDITVTFLVIWIIV